jgi:hypothetical protein
MAAVVNYDKLTRFYDAHVKRIERACTINIHETPEEKIKRIKDLEADYIRWFEYYFKDYATCKSAPFHKTISNIIIKNKVCKLLNDAFRGSAKSVHTMMGVPLYLGFVKKEMNFMLLIGENEEKAKRLISDVQAHLKHNTRFINDYGEQFNQGDWAEGNFTTKNGIHFHALGFGQDPRGLRFGEFRPDYIGCDDIDTLKRCNNDRLIREAIDYITGTLWGCFDKGKERFVFNNNLIHKNSIMAKLIELSKVANKESKKQGFKNPYHHIKTKAVLDDNFTPSWPAKYTAQYWLEKRIATPYRSWMREYMCTPLMDGAIFKPEWMQHCKMAKLDQYDALEFYGDLSYKDKGDYKAMFLMGKKGRDFHVIFSFCRQTSRSVCASWLYDLYEKWKLERYPIVYKIEGLFAMDEFVSDFDVEGDYRGYHIPVIADKRPKEGKFERIEANSGHFERLRVYWNEEEKETLDQTTAIDQHLSFEKGSGANDDAPDAVQGNMADLNKATFVSSFDMHTTSRSSMKERHF